MAIKKIYTDNNTELELLDLGNGKVLFDISSPQIENSLSIELTKDEVEELMSDLEKFWNSER